MTIETESNESAAPSLEGAALLEKTEREKTIRMTEKIFSEAVLLSVTTGFWRGSVQQTEEDMQAQGLVSKPGHKAIFKPGQKSLVNPEHLRPFQGFRSQVSYLLDQYSYPFPLVGVRFIPKKNIRAVLDKLDAIESEFNAKADEFCQKMEAFKQEMQQEFPEHWDNLKDCYPSAGDLRSRFYIERQVFTWNQAQIDDIAERERQRFTQITREFIKNANTHFREATIKAATSFKKALQSDGRVDNRSVEAFRGFVDRFNGLNFFDDKELEKLIVDMKSFLLNSESWIDDGKNSAVKEKRENISSVIDDIVRISSDVAHAEVSTKIYARSIELEMEEEEEQSIDRPQEESVEINSRNSDL